MRIVLSNNAKFKPYTFEEMLKPLAMATEAYTSIQDDISELGDKAELMKIYANREPDSKVASMYNSYANDLEKQAESLSKYGLTPKSRQGLLNMKKRYSSEIVPIEEAKTLQDKLVTEQRQAISKDPSLMFDIDYSRVSPDYLLNNPTATYTSVSGDALYARGKEAAIAASSRNKEILQALSGQYWQIRQGYGAEAANEFLLNQSSIPELKDAIGRLLYQSGVTKNNGERAVDYVISGMMAGLSTSDQYQANRNYIDAQAKATIELQREQWEFEKEYKRDQIEGVKLPNGNRLKILGSGKVVEIKPDGSYEISNASGSDNSSGSSGSGGGQASRTSGDPAKTGISRKTGLPLQPIMVDSYEWGAGPDRAGYVGEKEDSWFNWFSLPHKWSWPFGGYYTRSASGKYALADVEYVRAIPVEGVPLEWIKRIREKLEDEKEEFNAAYYNFYEIKDKTREAYIAMPKANDTYLGAIHDVSDAGNNLKNMGINP